VHIDSRIQLHFAINPWFKKSVQYWEESVRLCKSTADTVTATRNRTEKVNLLSWGSGHKSNDLWYFLEGM